MAGWSDSSNVVPRRSNGSSSRSQEHGRQSRRCARSAGRPASRRGGGRGRGGAVRALGGETCVASGGRTEKMAQTLRVTGLAGLFPAERIFSAYAVARAKPAPDLFLHAAARCGFAPGACVVVEDSVPGVEGGLAAGMRVLAYTAGDAAGAGGPGALGGEPLAELSELPARLGV